MEKLVPGALQRLRAADIIRIAGLASASLGQEYSRTASIQNTQRQGARLRGIVSVSSGTDPYTLDLDASIGEVEADAEGSALLRAAHVYPVEIEINGSTSWISSCPCSVGQAKNSSICAHAAALLYRWLSQPWTFELLLDAADASVTPATPSGRSQKAAKQQAASTAQDSLSTSPVIVRYSADLVGVLLQLGLGELRGIAREYNIAYNGASKQQISDMIVEAVKQPDMVRRVAATLEKEQRQLLAALVLAGGVLNDDDLRGLFERFSLGQPPQLQRVLLALQGKGLIFRTNSLGNEGYQRNSAAGNWLDIGWFVPGEVRAALHVSVPISLFDVEHPGEKHGQVRVFAGEPYQILDDLLLVARALSGYRTTPHDRWLPGNETMATVTDAQVGPQLPNTPNAPINSEHTASLPLPDDIPSDALVVKIQSVVPRPQAFLRWAMRVLALAGIVYRDENKSAVVQVLPEAAQVLLGSEPESVLRDLFQLWRQHASYSELYELTREGIQIQTRMTPLHVPILRQGELEEENREARQALLALLALTPRNEWVNFQGFVRFVYRLTPLFLQHQQRQYTTPHWWFEKDAGRPLKPLSFGDWQRAELSYIKHLLSGPLSWWGACDLALSEQGNLLAFRLNTVADALLAEYPVGAPFVTEPTLESAQELLSEIGTALRISANEDIQVACTRRLWPILELLEACAEAQGVDDEMLLYRLTPQTFGAALSRGDQRTRTLCRRLREFAVNPGGMPEEQRTLLLMLAERLEQWVEGYGRVRIYTDASVLEVADTAVAREIGAHTDLAKISVKQLQSTVYLLKKHAVKQLISDIKRHGQAPLEHNEDIYGAE